MFCKSSEQEVYSEASLGWPNAAMALNQEAYCFSNDTLICSDQILHCPTNALNYINCRVIKKKALKM